MSYSNSCSAERIVTLSATWSMLTYLHRYALIMITGTHYAGESRAPRRPGQPWPSILACQPHRRIQMPTMPLCYSTE